MGRQKEPSQVAAGPLSRRSMRRPSPQTHCHPTGTTTPFPPSSLELWDTSWPHLVPMEGPGHLHLRGLERKVRREGNHSCPTDSTCPEGGRPKGGESPRPRLKPGQGGLRATRQNTRGRPVHMFPGETGPGYTLRSCLSSYSANKGPFRVDPLPCFFHSCTLWQ